MQYRSFDNEYDKIIGVFECAIDNELIKFNSGMIACEAMLEANIASAEYKLVLESGTFEDSVLLFTEANNEAGEKKQGLISKMISAVRKWWTEFKKRVMAFFSKDPNKQVTDDGTAEGMKRKLDSYMRQCNVLRKKAMSGQNVDEELAALKAQASKDFEDAKNGIANAASKGAGTVTAVAGGVGAAMALSTWLSKYFNKGEDTITELENTYAKPFKGKVKDAKEFAKAKDQASRNKKINKNTEKLNKLEAGSKRAERLGKQIEKESTQQPEAAALATSIEVCKLYGGAIAHVAKKMWQGGKAGVADVKNKRAEKKKGRAETAKAKKDGAAATPAEPAPAPDAATPAAPAAEPAAKTESYFDDDYFDIFSERTSSRDYFF